MSTRRTFLLAGTSGMLSACAQGVWPLPSADGLAEGQAAWLVASLGSRWGRAALRFAIQFSLADAPNRQGEFVYSNHDPFASKADLEVEGASLKVIALRLAPGRYIATRVSTHPFATSDESAQVLDQPFELMPGRVTYLGEFIAWLAAAGVLPFGLSIPRSYVATLRDQSKRDFEVLRSRGLVLPQAPALKVPWLAGAAVPKALTPVGIRIINAT
jgi:hypothetical protein